MRLLLIILLSVIIVLSVKSICIALSFQSCMNRTTAFGINDVPTVLAFVLLIRFTPPQYFKRKIENF
jgi:hypothetical protein